MVWFPALTFWCRVLTICKSNKTPALSAKLTFANTKERVPSESRKKQFLVSSHYIQLLLCAVSLSIWALVLLKSHEGERRGPQHSWYKVFYADLTERAAESVSTVKYKTLCSVTEPRFHMHIVFWSRKKIQMHYFISLRGVRLNSKPLRGYTWTAFIHQSL